MSIIRNLRPSRSLSYIVSCLIVLVAAILLLTPLVAHADTGPAPQLQTIQVPISGKAPGVRINPHRTSGTHCERIWQAIPQPGTLISSTDAQLFLVKANGIRMKKHPIANPNTFQYSDGTVEFYDFRGRMDTMYNQKHTGGAYASIQVSDPTKPPAVILEQSFCTEG